jgi:hypothetical protein
MIKEEGEEVSAEKPPTLDYTTPARKPDGPHPDAPHYDVIWITVTFGVIVFVLAVFIALTAF